MTHEHLEPALLRAAFENAGEDTTRVSITQMLAEFGAKIRFSNQRIAETMEALNLEANPELVRGFVNALWEGATIAADLDWVIAMSSAGVPPELMLKTWLEVDESRRKEKEGSTT